MLKFQSVAGGGGARLIGLPVLGRTISSHLPFVLFPSTKTKTEILPVVLLLKVADFFIVRTAVGVSGRPLVRGVVMVVQVLTALFGGAGCYSPVMVVQVVTALL